MRAGDQGERGGKGGEMGKGGGLLGKGRVSCHPLVVWGICLIWNHVRIQRGYARHSLSSSHVYLRLCMSEREEENQEDRKKYRKKHGDRLPMSYVLCFNTR